MNGATSQLESLQKFKPRSSVRLFCSPSTATFLSIFRILIVTRRTRWTRSGMGIEFDSLSNKVIRAALNVHTALGPGLFEEVYKVCLRHELSKVGIKALSEVVLPVPYDGIQLNIGYRIDLLIEDTLIVELKSIEQFRSVHKAQLLTYLKLARKETGLLLNFNTPHLKQGIIRVVNSFPTSRTSRPSR